MSACNLALLIGWEEFLSQLTSTEENYDISTKIIISAETLFERFYCEHCTSKEGINTSRSFAVFF